MNVLTIGCFDMLHEGHVNLLTECGKRGEVVVAVHDDLSVFKLKGKFPVQTTSHRMRNLIDSGLVKATNCKPVASTDPSEFIEWIASMRSPLVFMRGDDMPRFPGRAKVEELGIPIEFVHYTEGISSTKRRDEL